MKQEEAIEIIRQHGGTIRSAEAISAGIYPRILYQLRDTEQIISLSRGVYRLADQDESSDPDLIVIAKRVPHGVLCLISALSFHGLTTQIPHEISIAIPKNSKAPKINFPPIRVHKFSDATYSAGVEEHLIDGVKVKVYNAEKTVVDCFRFRNQIGMDVVLEALKLYRSRRKMNSNLIMKYAELARIKSVITPYLEATL